MIPLRDNIPSRTKPIINVLIIMANAAVFYHEISITSIKGMLETFIWQWGAVPADFISHPIGALPTLATCMFIHGGWAHLIGNMAYLWIFGDNVEDKLGHFKYLVFYMLSGVIAGIAQIAAKPFTSVPLIGASGAIAGVLGAYFVSYPRSQILTFIPFGFFSRLVELPAYYFLGLWFLLQTAQGVGSLTERYYKDGDGIAWWAHAGGFIAGAILVVLLPNLLRRRRRKELII